MLLSAQSTADQVTAIAVGQGWQPILGSQAVINLLPVLAGNGVPSTFAG
jgi:hypothetical protein